MSRDWRYEGELEEPDHDRVESRRRPSPGKVSLTQRLADSGRKHAVPDVSSTPGLVSERRPSSESLIQRRAADEAFGLHLESSHVHRAASNGVSGPAQPLPHADRIQTSFGRHDVSRIRAHVGGPAQTASSSIGARAYAMGDQVAFADAPDLHTAAHEAAHVVQQRSGIQLYGGVGEAGDVYERHADRVADAVVRGDSAEALLDEVAGTTGSMASPARAVQRAGMDEVRRAEGGETASDDDESGVSGPEAAFLRGLRADRIVQSPRPLLLERGQPSSVTLLPLSAVPLPREAGPLPVDCKLLDHKGKSVAEASGQWLPMLVTGPSFTLSVPGDGALRVEIHVNAGRPGARVLRRRLVLAEGEKTDDVGAQEGSRLVAGMANQGITPSVETFHDMRTAVYAAQQLTRQGDEESYRRAGAMLEPVIDRLLAIKPRVYERSGDYDFSKPHAQRRFDAAVTELLAWNRRLLMGSRIATDEAVTEFRAAKDEIQLGTGEIESSSAMRALDKEAPRAIAAGTGALVATPIAIGVGATAGVEIAGAVGSTTMVASIYTWAASNPYSALLLSEILAGTAISMADKGGPKEYFGQIEEPEDIPPVVIQTLVDIVMARSTTDADLRIAPGSRGNRGGGDSSSDAPGSPGRRPPSSQGGGAESTPASRSGKAPGAVPPGGGEKPEQLAQHAAQAGMQPKHVRRFANIARAEQQTIIVRTSNPGSLPYHGKSGYRPKPPDVKQLKTAKGGPNDGLIVRPERPTQAQSAEIAKLEEAGWKFDDAGVLRDPQGKAIHGDYDLQGVYKHTPGGGGNQVDTNTDDFQRSINRQVDSKLKMVQHGANDDFKRSDPDRMGRQPGADESFLVIEPSGETRIVNSAAELQRYYEQHGFPWPYDDFTRK